jgi:importin-9
VKAASLISIKNLESMFKTEMQGHQSSVLNIISSLVEVAEEDTPAFLVEMLRFAAYINIQEAVKSSDIIRLLFTLASKDTSNVELNTVTSEVFEDMVESATESQQYLEICSNSLPSLLESVKSIQDWEYNPNLVLALSLIASLIEKGPEPLPLEVADYVVDPLYRILSNSTDDQVIQVASAAFSFLVDKCSLQLRNWKSDSGTGPQIILSIASNLLNPQFSDSATINCGHLISIIISKYGTDLGEVLTQLLEATAQRLSTAHNLLLVEVSVLCFSEEILLSNVLCRVSSLCLQVLYYNLQRMSWISWREFR